MEAIAKAKYQKGSPRKARLVIDLIRGKNVSHALAILKFTNKRAAGPIAKCLNSAIANATYKAEQQNIAIDPDDLWIKACFVDMGPTKNRRRLRPAPQGRAYFERRHYCHITIEVTSEAQAEEEEKTFEKRGKKVMAKKSGGDEKAKPAKKGKKAEKAAAETEEEVKEEKVEAAAEETAKAEEPKAEKSEEKVEAKEEVSEAVTEEKAETAEEKADDAEAEKEETESSDEKADSAANPETSEDPVGEETPENKPLAAKTDEEKTGTDEAADRQVDENEELERQ